MDLEEQFLGLKTLVAVRQTKLNEAKKLYEFLREVDEMADWINEQIQVASSEDYGQDFEHLQVELWELLACCADVIFFAELARVKKMSAQQAWELWGQLVNLVFYLL